ncbi:MAG: GntR family transcriptional regulator [Actinomycetota bacterium]
MGSTVRRSAPVPFYIQLADILRSEIAAGMWAPGEALPSEAELCKLHSVSRTAVRQALAQLVNEGVVVKEKGRGTFVRDVRRADFVVQELRGFYDEMTEKGHDVATRVLSLGVAPVPPPIAGDLGVRLGADVVRLFRVRSVDGTPICETETFLPLPRFAGLMDFDMSEHSLYSLLESEFDIAVSAGHRYIQAATAEASTAKNLGVARREPLLKLTGVNFDQAGVPVESYIALYRGDTTRFELDVLAQG